jgi:branched-chain amino acid transport system substrate-binding protein
MTTRSKVILLAALLVSALAVYRIATIQSARPTSIEMAEIKIGVAGPLTGAYASLGMQMQRGAEMAVADLNTPGAAAKGGVLGKQLVLLLGDDACDPKQAVPVANRMVSDGAVFVAGHFCSSSSIPASDVYAEEGVLQISPGSTNPLLTDRGPKFANVFRVCGRDDHQGQVAGEYIAKRFKDKKVAFLHDKTAYGKGLADETLAEFERQGGKAAMLEAYTAGEKDYSALVSKLKNGGIDVIYLGGYHAEAGLIVRQARAQGFGAQLISGDALITKEFWDIAGPAGEGTLMTFSPDPRKNPKALPVVERFRKAGFEPEGYTLYTYAAVEVFAQAAAKANSVKLADLIAAMRSTEFQTVLGPTRFDAKGDVTAPGYVMYEWKNGNYDYVD